MCSESTNENENEDVCEKSESETCHEDYDCCDCGTADQDDGCFCDKRKHFRFNLKCFFYI